MLIALVGTPIPQKDEQTILLSPDRESRNQIDYVGIDEMHVSTVRHVRTC